MTSKNFHYVMIGIFVLILGSSIGIVALGNGYLHSHANALKELKIQTSELEVQDKAYRQAKSDVEKYASLTAVINKAIPTDKDQARIILEINAIAKQCGIKIKTIQFPTSQLGAAPAAAATPTAESTTAAPGAPVAAAAPAATTTQITPVDGFVGIGAIKTDITPLVDEAHVVHYSQLIKFLELLESNQRTMQVADLHLSPQGKSASDSINFTLQLNIFTKLDTPAATVPAPGTK